MMGIEGFSEDILKQLKKLEAKYDAMGQDLAAYLDGLLHSDYLTYWDYIRLDTLLSLQQPKTSLPDEKTFILYHQITELYFKLILNEQDQLIFSEEVTKEAFLKHIQRINRYFDNLISSFDIMINGLDTDQFRSFRMSLLPASGFQSAQYRMIEIGATDFYLLVSEKDRDRFNQKSDIREVYAYLYWKNGAAELASGKKTLTLEQFEKKYAESFVDRAQESQNSNFRQIYLSKFKGDVDIIDQLKKFDHKVNVEWPLVHYQSAVKHLQKDPEVIKATGGTNWQKYLPPRRQQIIFYPEIWSTDELSSWGTKKQR